MLVLTAAAPAHAAVRYVDDTGGSDTTPCTTAGTPCATIAYAIGQAADDDEIVVAEGDYPQALSLTKRLTISGPVTGVANIAGTTTMLAVGTGGTGSLIQRLHFNLTSSSSIEAVTTSVPATFDDLVINVASTVAAGAFRSKLSGSTPAVLEDSVITASTTSAAGTRFTVGAEAGPLDLTNVEITRSDTSFVAALAAFDGSGALNPPSINADNVDIYTQGAACIFTRGGASTLANVSAIQQSAAPTSNSCVILGGFGSGAQDLTVTSSNQDTNTPNAALIAESGTTVSEASVSGSAVGAQIRCNSNVTLRRGTYQGGRAAIRIEGGTTGAVLSDLVARGSAPNASGVWVRDANCSGSDQGASAELRNVTAVSGSNGYGVYVAGAAVAASATLFNTIARGIGLFGSDIDAQGSNTASANYSNFDPARSTGVAPGGIGNQAADPMFASSGGGDFHLQAGSPAINAGFDDGNLGPFDFEGHARVQGAAVDIGADEHIPQPPGATTAAASDIGASGATLNGTVNPQGQSTNYKFQYGTTTAYGSETGGSTLPGGTSSQAVSKGVTGLAPETLYHFRIVATNGAGTTVGADQAFLTAVAPLPAETPAAETPPATTTPTPTPTPTPTGSGSALGPLMVISASPVTITKTGVANIRLGCPATAAGFCQGTLTLRTATRVNVAAKRVLTLGKRTFKIAAGRRGVVGVKLSRQARRVLRRAKRLRIKAIANVRDGNGAARITQRLLSLKAR